MQKWEYKFLSLSCDPDEAAWLARKFHKLGRKGWELVAIWREDTAIFKRPIEDNEEYELIFDLCRGAICK